MKALFFVGNMFFLLFDFYYFGVKQFLVKKLSELWPFSWVKWWQNLESKKITRTQKPGADRVKTPVCDHVINVQPLTFLWSGSECPEKNRNYIEREDSEVTENVWSWVACSDICSARADCTAWTLNTKRHMCITMRSFGIRRYEHMRVSGSRECKGKIIW